MGKLFACVAGAAVAFAVVAATTPAGAGATDATLPSQVWGIELSPAAANQFTPGAARAFADQRLNMVIVDGARTSPKQLARVAGAARSASLVVLASVAPTAPPRACVRAVRCVAQTSDPAVARRIARGGRVVVLRVANVAAVAATATATATASRGRIVVVAPVGASNFDAAAWGRAIDIARASGAVDLAIAPPAALGSDRERAIAEFTNILANGVPRTRPGDPTPPTTPPPAPQNLHTVDVGTTAAVVAWDPPVGMTVDHYEHYVNGVSVGTSTTPKATVAGLTCNVPRNVVGIEAVDASGHHSARASLDVVAAACGGGGGGGGGTPTPTGGANGAPAPSPTSGGTTPASPGVPATLPPAQHVQVAGAGSAAGVVLDVPANAFPIGGQVSIAPTTVADGAPAGAVGQAYAINATTEPSAPVALAVPPPTGGAPTSYTLAWWSDDAAAWQPVPTTYDAVRGALVANIGHFSQWASVSKWFLKQVAGAHGDAPKCAGAGPSWLQKVQTTATDDLGLALSCVGDGPDNLLDVKVVAHRSAAIYVQFTRRPIDATYSTEGGDTIPAVLMYPRGNDTRIYVPAGFTLDAVFDRPPATADRPVLTDIQGFAGRDAWTYLTDVVTNAINNMIGDWAKRASIETGALYDCAIEVIDFTSLSLRPNIDVNSVYGCFVDSFKKAIEHGVFDQLSAQTVADKFGVLKRASMWLTVGQYAHDALDAWLDSSSRPTVLFALVKALPAVSSTPSDRAILALAATNKVVTVTTNGTSYFFDGTTLHWIPDVQTYWCLVDGGKPVVTVATQAEADLLGDGKPWQPQCLSASRLVGHIVREATSGASYTVEANNTWHWIPNGGTYTCLVASMPVIQSNWAQINSLRGAHGEHEGAHATCTAAAASERNALVAAASGKVVTVTANGTSYFFDGTKLHWIPDAQTYWCLVDGARTTMAVTQAQADALGDGKPWQEQCLSIQRVTGHVVRESSSGASYTVDTNNTWHWIPSSAVYNCLVAKMSVVESNWTQINSLRGPNGEHEGAHAICVSARDELAAAAANHVLGVPNGSAYFFDGATLHWIQDMQTYWCLVDGGRTVMSVTQAQADSLGNGQPWQPQCFSVGRVAGHVVRESSSGASYTVDGNNTWHWIPDPGTYSCLTATMSVIESNWTQINSLRGPNGEHEGAHATCVTEHDRLLAAATGKVLTSNTGSSYYFDGHTLHWIQDMQTYWCLVDGGRPVMSVTQAQADSLGNGQPWQPQCFSLGRVIGHIVRESSSGASYTVTRDGRWHWIPSSAIYNCLAAKISVIESNWTQINSLRGPNGEHEGAHATC